MQFVNNDGIFFGSVSADDFYIGSSSVQSALSGKEPSISTSTSASVLDGTKNWKSLFGTDGKILTSLYTAGSSAVDYLHFNSISAAPTYAEGNVYYDAVDHTLNVQTDTSACTLNIGQEMFVRAYNRTGSLIPNGTVVYVNGSQGLRPTITPAQANAESTSEGVIGMTTMDIPTGTGNTGWGYVCTFGLVHDLNTQAFAVGSKAYLSTTSAGQITTTEPVAPNHRVIVGFVIESHPNQGIVLVNVDEGLELSELHDVYTSGMTNNQILTYVSANSRWENSTLLHNSISGIDGSTYHLSSTAYGALSGITTTDTTKWNNTYATVSGSSASWNAATTKVNTSSAGWDQATLVVNTTSATWNGITTVINNTSATWNTQNNHTHNSSAITNFYISALNDVSATGPIHGQFLSYSSAINKYVLTTATDVDLVKKSGTFNITANTSGYSDETFGAGNNYSNAKYLIQFFDESDTSNIIQNFSVTNRGTTGFRVWWNAIPQSRTITWITIG